MRDNYQLGGNVNLRLRMNELMKHDCFVAKEAYRKLCRDLRDPKYAGISEKEAIALYENYKKNYNGCCSTCSIERIRLCRRKR